MLTEPSRIDDGEHCLTTWLRRPACQPMRPPATAMHKASTATPTKTPPRIEHPCFHSLRAFALPKRGWRVRHRARPRRIRRNEDCLHRRQEPGERARQRPAGRKSRGAEHAGRVGEHRTETDRSRAPRRAQSEDDRQRHEQGAHAACGRTTRRRVRRSPGGATSATSDASSRSQDGWADPLDQDGSPSPSRSASASATPTSEITASTPPSAAATAIRACRAAVLRRSRVDPASSARSGPYRSVNAPGDR